jgi:AAA15 family ATPase/GTPase
MLREYHLTNFKAFAGPETIPIRPITLIYGPNSSGKSSILQSLLLLKQTLQEAENPETLLLPKGNLINLGGYRDFIHRHDVSKPFSFKVVLDEDKQETLDAFEKLLPKELVKTPLLGLQVAFNYEQQVSNVVLESCELFFGNYY